MKRITIPLGKRSYTVAIDNGLLNKPESFSPLKTGDQAVLVTNETLAPLYINKVCYILEKIGIDVDNIVLPDGEQTKSLMTLNTIFTSLLQKQYSRDAILIALGGGVIGDLTGFAAASYQRGIRFIQAPTTLLSQVDSSIGGKTAVNHPLGKNMIGAFWHPASVLIDLKCLKTLPLRELSSGLAEVIKYGAICDSAFFSWLEENIDALLHLDDDAVSYCICRCCELKAQIVTADEYEIGLRALLNFGHTCGHAIEAKMGYGNWLHGEAVSVGMVIAARASEYLGQFKQEETQRIITLLQRARLPVMGPREMSAQSYLPYIMRDKKVLAGELRLVLILAIGKGKICSGISHEVILRAIADCQQK